MYSILAGRETFIFRAIERIVEPMHKDEDMFLDKLNLFISNFIGNGYRQRKNQALPCFESRLINPIKEQWQRIMYQEIRKLFRLKALDVLLDIMRISAS